MRYEITIEDKALQHIQFFKKHDLAIAKKIQNLLAELLKNPFQGLGKPEPLKFELSGYWSRRITREHHMVYAVRGEKISVISCKYHY
jgi:toxin YoeB